MRRLIIVVCSIALLLTCGFYFYADHLRSSQEEALRSARETISKANSQRRIGHYSDASRLLDDATTQLTFKLNNPLTSKFVQRSSNEILNKIIEIKAEVLSSTQKFETLVSSVAESLLKLEFDPAQLKISEAIKASPYLDNNHFDLQKILDIVRDFSGGQQPALLIELKQNLKTRVLLQSSTIDKLDRAVLATEEDGAKLRELHERTAQLSQKQLPKLQAQNAELGGVPLTGKVLVWDATRRRMDPAFGALIDAIRAKPTDTALILFAIREREIVSIGQYASGKSANVERIRFDVIEIRASKILGSYQLDGTPSPMPSGLKSRIDFHELPDISARLVDWIQNLKRI